MRVWRDPALRAELLLWAITVMIAVGVISANRAYQSRAEAANEALQSSRLATAPFAASLPR